ncbi:MAG: diguanylate cyclase [Lyngbya sp. HA4199-MV5]|jgi:diguanylate cyclase (GGDEF)-like protein|nr:diguanylate cyclase [Lyngbya sp. HA4199-MV5]
MVAEKETILVVDDHPDNIRTLSIILGSHGYKVRKATSGEMAIDTILSQPPALVLLDIKMPMMDGYEVCTKLKAITETCHVPIVFLSALDGAEDKIRAFEVGGADYITKPFNEEEVLARVRHQLTIQQQRQQLIHQNQQLQREILERQQAQAETQLFLDTIQAVSEAADLETALQATLCSIQQAIAWDYGEAWMLDDDDMTFHLCQVSYDRQNVRLKQFHETSTAITFSYRVGLPGRIWALGQPEWIESLAQQSEQTFLRGEAAIVADLASAFGVPIVVEERILAVLVFFSRKMAAPNAKLLRLTKALALHLGVSMQRKLAEASLKQVNRELHRIASIDELTQIPNRRTFDAFLQTEWGRSRREHISLSLILCDIDYFKRYNDRYGHPAGDDCLQKVAQAINNSIRRPADLAARYGGEEFAAVLPNTTPQGAVYIAQRIQQAICQLKLAHADSTASDCVTLSMGIASLVPTQEQSLKEIITFADQALYTAKARGRNTFCLSVHTDDASITRYSLR